MIVGIGWHKTGTTTLGEALSALGFNHLGWSSQAFEHWSAGDDARLMRLLARFDSCDDFPWPFVFEKVDAAFPGSRFILTRRSDSLRWFDSICKHANRTGPIDERRRVYGFAMPHENTRAFISAYEKHNDAVRRYFKGRPRDLLEVCWEEGGEALCEFLDLQRPDCAFPHANRSPAD